MAVGAAGSSNQVRRPPPPPPPKPVEATKPVQAKATANVQAKPAEKNQSRALAQGQEKQAQQQVKSQQTQNTAENASAAAKGVHAGLRAGTDASRVKQTLNANGGTRSDSGRPNTKKVADAIVKSDTTKVATEVAKNPNIKGNLGAVYSDVKNTNGAHVGAELRNAQAEARRGQVSVGEKPAVPGTATPDANRVGESGQVVRSEVKRPDGGKNAAKNIANKIAEANDQLHRDIPRENAAKPGSVRPAGRIVVETPTGLTTQQTIDHVKKAISPTATVPAGPNGETKTVPNRAHAQGKFDGIAQHDVVVQDAKTGRQTTVQKGASETIPARARNGVAPDGRSFANNRAAQVKAAVQQHVTNPALVAKQKVEVGIAKTNQAIADQIIKAGDRAGATRAGQAVKNAGTTIAQQTKKALSTPIGTRLKDGARAALQSRAGKVVARIAKRAVPIAAPVLDTIAIGSAYMQDKANGDTNYSATKKAVTTAAGGWAGAAQGAVIGAAVGGPVGAVVGGVIGGFIGSSIGSTIGGWLFG